MVTVQKLLERIEKKGVPRGLVEQLLRGRVKDAEAFTDKARLLEIIRPQREAGTEAFLERDEEHGVFDLQVQAGGNGHAREVVVGDDFVTSAEYRSLYSAYEEIRELDEPPSHRGGWRRDDRGRAVTRS